MAIRWCNPLIMLIILIILIQISDAIGIANGYIRKQNHTGLGMALACF